MGGKQPRRNLIKAVLWAVFVGLALSIAFRLIFFGHLASKYEDSDFIGLVMRNLENRYWGEVFMIIGQLVLMASAVIIGAWFFKLRSHSPRLYGLIEIVFGVFLIGCVVSIAYDASPLLNLLATVSAIYVIVRGFDNISRSIVAPEDKAAWERLFGRL